MRTFSFSDKSEVQLSFCRYFGSITVTQGTETVCVNPNDVEVLKTAIKDFVKGYRYISSDNAQEALDYLAGITEAATDASRYLQDTLEAAKEKV